MPDLSAIARERVALATIADAIVTAGFGRGLRVAVACPDSHLAVVGHLTRALQGARPGLPVVCREVGSSGRRWFAV